MLNRPMVTSHRRAVSLTTSVSPNAEVMKSGMRRCSMSNGMLLSAVREVDGKEELHLVMLDDSVPAGAQLC